MSADPGADDQTLIDRAVAGDGTAFTELLQRHDDNMRGVVWRIVESRAAMDDVLQDAYLKAWRALANFRGDAAFGSWLYRIVYTTAIDHVRVVARRSVVPLHEIREVGHDDSTAQIADGLALRDALATLPEDQLAVVCLIDGQGASYDDVARLLGIQEGTVGSRLSRARAALRRELGSREGDHS